MDRRDGRIATVEEGFPGGEGCRTWDWDILSPGQTTLTPVTIDQQSSTGCLFALSLSNCS